MNPTKNFLKKNSKELEFDYELDKENMSLL